MVTFLIISGIVVAIVLIWAWVRLVNWMLPTKKSSQTTNPYIQAHLMRRDNDAHYEEYLNWLDKTGGGLPIEKLKTKEELKFEKQINLD